MQMGMKRLFIIIVILCCVLFPLSSDAKEDIYVVAVGVSDYKTIDDLLLPEQVLLS